MSEIIANTISSTNDEKIKLESNECGVYECKLEAAKMSLLIKNMLETINSENGEQKRVPLKNEAITDLALQKIIEWMEYHFDDPPPDEDFEEDKDKRNEELSLWDKTFIDVPDQGHLFDIIAGAYILDIKGLIKVVNTSTGDYKPSKPSNSSSSSGTQNTNTNIKTKDDAKTSEDSSHPKPETDKQELERESTVGFGDEFMRTEFEMESNFSFLLQKENREHVRTKFGVGLDMKLIVSHLIPYNKDTKDILFKYNNIELNGAHNGKPNIYYSQVKYELNGIRNAMTIMEIITHFFKHVSGFRTRRIVKLKSILFGKREKEWMTDSGLLLIIPRQLPSFDYGLGYGANDVWDTDEQNNDMKEFKNGLKAKIETGVLRSYPFWMKRMLD